MAAGTAGNHELQSEHQVALALVPGEAIGPGAGVGGGGPPTTFASPAPLFANGAGLSRASLPAAFRPGDDGGLAFAAVPEPATWAMMLAGFGAAGATLRVRRKRGYS